MWGEFNFGSYQSDIIPVLYEVQIEHIQEFVKSGSLRYCPGILIKKFSLDSRPRGRDLKAEPPEYEAGAVTTCHEIRQPQHSMQTVFSVRFCR
jgi:hypothetical protein